MKVSPLFQVGDKVVFTAGDGRGMVIVPYLRAGRVYSVRQVLYRHGIERVALVGHRLDARMRKGRQDDTILAEYFRLVHRADEPRPRKEAA